MIKNSAFKLLPLVLFLTACGTHQTAVNTPLNSDNTVISQSAPTAKYFKDLAKNRLWLIEMEARKWDMSAKFVKTAARDVERDGRAYWGYYFKSPFKKNALFVIPDGGSFEVREPLFSNEIREFDWKIDSDAAVKIARENGVNRFPIQEMTLENRVYPEWILLTSQGYLRINAQDGSVNKSPQTDQK